MSALDLPPKFNIADHLILPNLAGERAKRPYMFCADHSLTYGELHERSNRVGNALAELGVEPEHRVMMLMLYTLEFPVCFCGAIRLGAVAVPALVVYGPELFGTHERGRSNGIVISIRRTSWVRYSVGWISAAVIISITSHRPRPGALGSTIISSVSLVLIIPGPDESTPKVIW